ncbi:hypothetical protein JTE90_029422 [Oedothorax gibbosus]|uniref:BACK domain-containing protein n=1 Tax=Oedothorax gibbosus TaxID=931172 RepID=A0AAV6U0X6_9ARAC|nr:hypothetical protein JTE90_029422 [Oedothorax gibbosus]
MAPILERIRHFFVSVGSCFRNTVTDQDKYKGQDAYFYNNISDKNDVTLVGYRNIDSAQENLTHEEIADSKGADNKDSKPDAEKDCEPSTTSSSNTEDSDNPPASQEEPLKALDILVTTDPVIPLLKRTIVCSRDETGLQMSFYFYRSVLGNNLDEKIFEQLAMTPHVVVQDAHTLTLFVFNVLKHNFEEASFVDSAIYFGSMNASFRLCVQFLALRLEKMVLGSDYLMLSKAHIEVILQQDVIGARSEFVVYLAALKWLRFNFQERKQFARDLFGCVRFCQMTNKEIIALYQPPLLDDMLRLPEINDLIDEALIKTESSSTDSTFNKRMLLLEGKPFILKKNRSIRRTWGKEKLKHQTDLGPRKEEASNGLGAKKRGSIRRNWGQEKRKYQTDLGPRKIEASDGLGAKRRGSNNRTPCPIIWNYKMGLGVKKRSGSSN